MCVLIFCFFILKYKKKYEYNSSSASSEGVQNDFLPLFDGSDIPVKEGRNVIFTINTRNILFVCLGAFTKNKPSDLITEVQGRLPIQVSVDTLTPEDFKKILMKSRLSTLNQSIQLLKTEGLNIEFTEKAIDKICDIVYEINQSQEDTGARRLVSIIDAIVDEISFYAPELAREYARECKDTYIKLDHDFVELKCADIIKNKKDSKKYII